MTTQKVEFSRERFCKKCNRKTEHVKKTGCVVCSAFAEAKEHPHRWSKHSLDEISYTPHDAASALSDVDAEIAERAKLLRSGVNPFARAAPTIEELLSGEDDERN